MRFYTHAVFHKPNVEKCQIDWTEEPKGAACESFLTANTLIGCHRTSCEKVLLICLFEQETAATTGLEQICQIIPAAVHSRACFLPYKRLRMILTFLAGSPPVI